MKVREAIFYAGKTLYWVIIWVFHGDTKKGEISIKYRELPNKVLCPNTKNNFPNVRIVGELIGLCPRGLHTDIKNKKKSRSP